MAIFFRILLATLFMLVASSSVRAQQFKLYVPDRPDQATKEFIDTLLKDPALRQAEIIFKPVPISVIGSWRDLTKIIENGTAKIALLPYEALASASLADSPYSSLAAQPGLFKHSKKHFELFDSVFGDIIASELGNYNLAFVDFWHRVPKDLYSSGRILEVNDFKGRQVVAYGRVANETMHKLGATSLKVLASEVFTALQTGLFDTAEITSNLRSAKDYANLGGGTYLGGFKYRFGFLAANSRFWLHLTQEQRNAIKSAARNAKSKSKDIIYDTEKQVADLVRETKNVVFTSFAKGNALKADSGIVPASFALTVWRSQQKTNSKSAEQALQLFHKISHAKKRRQKSEMPEKRGNTNQNSIMFATSRNEYPGVVKLINKFGAERMDHAKLKCGALLYLKPENKSLGDLYSGGLTLDQSKMMTGIDQCVSLIAQRFISDGGTPTIYIHGFWNDFITAARRAVAIKEDFGLDSTMLMWSWPSMGNPSYYDYDEDSVEWDQIYVEKFISKFLKHYSGPKLNIVAHSMGSRVALNLLKAANSSNVKIGRFIFVAPDVVRSNFRQSVLNFAGGATNIHLYASDWDRALQLSKTKHKRSLAGQAGTSLIVMSELETIDVSDVDNEWFEANHSHAFDVPEAARDLKVVILSGEVASKRGLLEGTFDNLTFWQIKPDK